ncbi:helix-turn-helix domain-containing protein [Bradyrhizobium sp. NBAIM08]|uniref:helix-turn-helix domain-containing protein n=1 Tax=Bradyrhizobium sp. NBAIM08 TaxID=2793815 RepID=UPI001CD52775|nr:helix-turn-helix transcriptional regulator [Bradyrhizobium sp. NBAIM08]MCA1474147.1 helix-turn-helix transcriptional regulator [Bradyrhizobium sp. NBAIM08]
MLRDNLARRIRQLRLSLRLSQRDLADRAGVRQALISQIELGEANVTLDSLLKIAIALHVDFDALFAAGADTRPLAAAEVQRRHLP